MMNQHTAQRLARAFTASRKKAAPEPMRWVKPERLIQWLGVDAIYFDQQVRTKQGVGIRNWKAHEWGFLTHPKKPGGYLAYLVPIHALNQMKEDEQFTQLLTQTIQEVHHGSTHTN